jgi:hypothetical protein
VFRDYETDGVPASGSHKVKKSDVRQLLGEYESTINAFLSNGGLIYSNKAAMDADLAHGANSSAWVIGDATVANNGIYRKIGASGVGSWTRVADLPFSFIIASDAGAGTPNAIQATTAIPVSGSALVWMNIFETNTASPVTVSFNGGSALTIKTNSGNDVAAGGLTAGMVVMGIVSGGTFRLVSDQASAAIVAAAEAAADRAEAAAAGVTLPSAVASTYLRQKSDISGYEVLTAQQVRDDIDPLRDFAADGSTDDTGNFSGYRAQYPNRVLDLDSHEYEVTALPMGPAVNGTYVVPGAGEGGGTIRFPALALKREISRKIAWGDYHSNWPQGKNNLVYNGTLFSVWMEGGGHEAADMHVRLARTVDNGSTWRDFERLFQTSAARSCWAAAVIQGRLFLVVRIHSGAHDDPAITGATIYSRRIGERRERKLNPITGVDASNMEIRATSGSATIRVANCPKHGALPGSVVNITNVGATVGGRTVSGDYTVTNVGVDWFEFTHPSGAATFSQTATSDFTLKFKEEATWTEHLFGGDTIYTEVTQFPGTTRNGTNPFYFHGAAEIKTDTSGAMYLGVTGGAAGPAIAKVTGLLNGTPALAKMTTIDSSAGRGEPAFDVSSTGILVGFLRNNSETSSGGVFWSTNDITTITNRLNFPASNDFRYAPFGVSIDKSDDTVYAVTTGNRVRGVAGQTTAGEVPVYKITASVGDIVANGAASIKVEQFKKIWFANESQGDTGNGVGVGACAVQDGVLHVFMATETQNQRNSVFGAPDIEYDRLYLKPPTTEEAASRLVASVAQGEPNVQYAGRFVGMGAWHIIGLVNADGTVAWSDGSFTISRPSAGRYDLTLRKSPGHQRWFPVVQINDVSPVAIGGTHFSNSTYSLRMAGAVDKPFFVTAFVNYQPYRTDWGGDVA